MVFMLIRCTFRVLGRRDRDWQDYHMVQPFFVAVIRFGSLRHAQDTHSHIDISHSSDCLDHARTSTKQQSRRIQPTQLNTSPVRKALPCIRRPRRSGPNMTQPAVRWRTAVGCSLLAAAPHANRRRWSWSVRTPWSLQAAMGPYSLQMGPYL